VLYSVQARVVLHWLRLARLAGATARLVALEALVSPYKWHWFHSFCCWLRNQGFLSNCLAISMCSAYVMSPPLVGVAVAFDAGPAVAGSFTLASRLHVACSFGASESIANRSCLVACFYLFEVSHFGGLAKERLHTKSPLLKLINI
jgi:hypothetical protein